MNSFSGSGWFDNNQSLSFANSSTATKIYEQDVGLDATSIRERLQSLEDGVILEIMIGGEDSGKE